MSEPALLEVTNAVVEFGARRGRFRAVDDVSLTIRRGETLGLIGESGSGKSTLARAILGLTPLTGGRIAFDGEQLHTTAGRRSTRAPRRMQVVFQDPFSSLNPTQTVAQILAEPLWAQGVRAPAEVGSRVREMLARVGIDVSAASRYPRQFSGGQRQRIAIARALILEPSLLICDESLSALDLSVQAQIANLLMDLQRRMDLSFLFIAHDLAIVQHMAQRVAVMSKGRIVESGESASVFADPQDAYTRELIAAAPLLDPVRQRARRTAAA